MMLDRRLILAAACALPLLATPASAQFGSIFGGQQSPRPPGDIPSGHPSAPPMEPRNFPQFDPREAPPEPPPPPLTRFPQGVPPQGQGMPRNDVGVQTQPLPPPPGSPPPTQPANVPGAAPQGQPPNTLPGLPPGQRQPRGTPQSPDGEAQPGDEVVVAPPPHKIANPTAVFAGLDKITGRIISFDVAIDETVQFGALRLTPRACYTRPPTETANTDGFVEVDEITLKGEVKRIFTGWMFAASPGLHAVEHPIYDVWLTECKGASPKVAGADTDNPPPQAGTPVPPPNAAPAPAPAQRGQAQPAPQAPPSQRLAPPPPARRQ